MIRSFFFILLLSLCRISALAQELNAKVTVIHTQVQGIDPKVFQTLEQNLNTFLNSRKWTNDHFQNNEKIDCSFLLNITKKAKDDNIFTAVLSIQASRPVYNTDYNTPTVNFQDNEVAFSFDQSQTIQFDDNNVAGSDPLVSNLTAIFAYYVYYIIGLDYDSFSPNGGTAYFQKAQDIVNKAPEKSSVIQGWQASGSTNNRYWLVGEILNPRFKEFRTFWYTYHRKGLDLMTEKPQDALKNIFSGIPILAAIHKENTNPVILQFYFDAKSSEWANLLQQAPQADRAQYAKQMMAIDVTNANKYRNIK
ncbi:MAG TPA: DUF4835 family protein [Edaphocola sp.]|nr:DUF4835 family protein [Edaphocola sp.]